MDTDPADRYGLGAIPAAAQRTSRDDSAADLLGASQHRWHAQLCPLHGRPSRPPRGKRHVAVRAGLPASRGGGCDRGGRAPAGDGRGLGKPALGVSDHVRRFGRLWPRRSARAGAAAHTHDPFGRHRVDGGLVDVLRDRHRACRGRGRPPRRLARSTARGPLAGPAGSRRAPLVSRAGPRPPYGSCLRPPAAETSPGWRRLPSCLEPGTWPTAIPEHRRGRSRWLAIWRRFRSTCFGVWGLPPPGWSAREAGSGSHFSSLRSWPSPSHGAGARPTHSRSGSPQACSPSTSSPGSTARSLATSSRARAGTSTKAPSSGCSCSPTRHASCPGAGPGAPPWSPASF